MAFVEVNGKIKKDERRNGARLKLSGSDWLKILLFVLGLSYTCGTISTAVANNSKINGEQDARISAVEGEVHKAINHCSINDRDIDNFKGIVEDLKEGQQKIFDLLLERGV